MNAAKWYMRQVPFFKKWLNISSMPGQFYMLDLQHAKYNVHSMGVSGIKIFLPLKTIDRFESRFWPEVFYITRSGKTKAFYRD
jgi:hypothetical protein